METKPQDPLTAKIIACCFKVHSELGPGFPEKIYHKAILFLLQREGLFFESEREFAVFFQSQKVGSFRADLVIERKVIVELKAVSGRMPIIFEYQTLSYLKASKLKIGLIVNFGNKSCEVRRMINREKDFSDKQKL